MAKSTQPNFTQQMLQQGFEQIDSSMAQDDPEMGALIDGLIQKLAVPMARRMGVSAQALQQLTMNVIRQRARQMMAEESQTRRTKMETAQRLGQAERAADLQLAGLKMKEKAFDRQIAMRYVGAALSAAGSFIGQGIASGLFEADPDVWKGPNNPDGSMPASEDINPDDLATLQKMTKEAYHPMHDIDASQTKMRPTERLEPRGTNPEFETMDIGPVAVRTPNVRSSPDLEETFPADTLQELGALQPTMRHKKDRDKFAGILNALRGGFA